MQLLAKLEVYRYTEFDKYDEFFSIFLSVLKTPLLVLSVKRLFLCLNVLLKTKIAIFNTILCIMHFCSCLMLLLYKFSSPIKNYLPSRHYFVH